MSNNSSNFPDEDLVSKIDTSEGNTIYLICRLKSHPIGVKTYFNFGTITIFEEGKQNGYYRGELISQEVLNNHTEWSSDLFKRLRLCLEEQREKFSIVFKVAKGSEFIGLKVKCSLISTNRVFESLMNEVIQINQAKKKQTKQLDKKIENLETEKLVILENMDQISQTKQQLENEMIEKFTVILNEKKKKIISLQQEIENFKSGNMDFEYPKSSISNTQKQKIIPYDEDSSSQLTTYKMDLSGSQFNFIRDNKNMDRKRNETQSESQIFQTQQSIEFPPTNNTHKSNDRKHISDTQLSLQDLF